MSMYLVSLIALMILVAAVGVALNPSPYFGSMTMVILSVMMCAFLTLSGWAFPSLILLLIYSGGMLVVFSYSSAFAWDEFPDTWAGRGMVFGLGIFGVLISGGLVLAAGGAPLADWFEGLSLGTVTVMDFSVIRTDFSGVATMYSWGGLMLVVGGWVLLLTLFVVLEMVRGSSRGALRVG